ncbi:MAG: ASCH domain-containing protein [Planctomycetia bacterium]|nr:ASCH domain-containing protein [Planctomycetia bacterium]
MAFPAFHPDPEIISLGVRQPWVELILRGVKTIEVRTTNTQVRGTIYLYASKKFSSLPAAEVAAEKHGLDTSSLPTGLLVGSIELWNTRRATPRDATAACVPLEVLRQNYAWELRNPRRFPQPSPVRFLPYGVWFYPFRRRAAAT